MTNRIYLSLGSNIDPVDNFINAVRSLAEYGTIEAVSTVWQTKPIGYADQNNFLNAVILIETNLELEAFQNSAIPKIEAKLGRIRSKNKFGPRSIDIDILLFNNLVGEIGHRRIPSPEITDRAFVGVPLAEIAPLLIHPEKGETLAQVAEKFAIDPDEMRQRPDIDLWKALGPNSEL